MVSGKLSETSTEKFTTLLDYRSHYNKGLNKCFILVEYHYSLDKDGSWMNHMSVWDVYENVEYGQFVQNHMNFGKVQNNKVIGCQLAGNKCTSLDQFNGLVHSYLEN